MMTDGTSLIERVREGMVVVDRTGERVGTVEYVQFGDPQAVTTKGNDLEDPGLIGEIGIAAFGDEREPDVAEPKRSQLLRYGFLKVDGPGLLDRDRYVRSDLITGVSGDRVMIRVDKEHLVTEA